MAEALPREGYPLEVKSIGVLMKATRKQIALASLVVWPFLSGLLAATPVNAQEIPLNETGFTDFVATELRKEVGDAAVVIKGPLTLGLGELQANLDRVYAYCRKNADGCSKEVTAYVKGAAEVHKDRNAPPTRDAVRLVLRSPQYVKLRQGSIPSGSPSLQPRPFVEGLIALPVVDSPRTLRMLVEKDNAALGLNADEVFQLGLVNTRANLKPLMDVAKVVAKGQIGQLVDDAFSPSRLVFIDTWAPLAEAHGGTLIVSAPATDAVLYIGEDTPVAIDAFRVLIRRVTEQAPNRLSEDLYRWTPTGWVVVR